MKRILLMAIATVVIAATTSAQTTMMVGGAAMYPTKNIIQNAVNSKDHTILVAAVKAADLVDALQDSGPFTVFAPTDEAFKMLPAGTVDNLLKPENKSQLQNLLKYHVVAGKWDANDLKKMIKKEGGKATIKTLNGENLYANLDDAGNVWIWDENGSKAMVTIADVYQQNGVIHVIDHVLFPKM